MIVVLAGRTDANVRPNTAATGLKYSAAARKTRTRTTSSMLEPASFSAQLMLKNICSVCSVTSSDMVPAA